MKIVIAISDYAYAAALKVASPFYKPVENVHNPHLETVIIIPGVYEI